MVKQQLRNISNVLVVFGQANSCRPAAVTPPGVVRLDHWHFPAILGGFVGAAHKRFGRVMYAAPGGVRFSPPRLQILRKPSFRSRAKNGRSCGVRDWSTIGPPLGQSAFIEVAVL